MLEPVRTVAIVEDDDLVRSATVSLIRSLGLDVVSFRSAPEFLDAPIRALGCIVSDLHMPGMSGLELYDALRASGSTVPFILMTAYATDQIRERARESGILCLLEKPGTPEMLVRCMAEVVGPLP